MRLLAQAGADLFSGDAGRSLPKFHTKMIQCDLMRFEDHREGLWKVDPPNFVDEKLCRRGIDYLFNTNNAVLIAAAAKGLRGASEDLASCLDMGIIGS